MTEKSSFEKQGIIISSYANIFYKHHRQISFEN